MLHRRVFVGAFALVLAILGTWAGAHFIRPLPEARWTSADLPALPPDAENVFGLLGASTRTPDLDALVVDEYAEVARVLREGRAREPELVDALAPSTELRAAIRQRPRYVESSGMLGRSRVMEGIATWKTRALAVLLALVEEESVLAGEEVASMWTQAVDYSNHCQSMVSCMAGQRLLHITLGAAELLAHAAPREASWVARLLESSTEDRTAITHGIIAEYVYGRMALETHDAPLFDRAQTDRMLANHFESAIAFALDPTQPRPRPRFREHPLWWTYNPTGKTFASGFTIQHFADAIERYGREADAITTRRDALLESIRASNGSAGSATDGAAVQLAGEDAGAMATLHAPQPLGGSERQ